LAYGVSMRVFGVTVAGLRALSVLAGTVTVLTTFLLAKELWGRRVAWLAAIVLTCSHFHIHFSRLGSNQIFDGLFITLSLWLLVRALRSRRVIGFALAGATMGLGWYGYFGARLVGLVVACYLAWRAVVEYRLLVRFRWHLLVLVGSALVIVAPLLFHYAEQPHELVSRVRQVSIFASGWLLREQQTTGRSVASLLIQQLWRSISAFNYTLDPTFWYHASIPLLDMLSGILFVLGLMWVVVRRRWPGNGLLLLWFWLAVILGWVMTENPPSSMRLTIIAPALAILVSLGLDWLLVSVRDLFGMVKIVGSVPRQRFDPWIWVGGLLVAAIAVVNLYYYFLVYTPTRVYGNPTAEVGTELGRHLVEEAGDRFVYFYGPPFMYWEFGTLAFLARGVEGMSMPSLGDGEMPAVDLEQGAWLVFLPERLAELDAVRERYPGGEQMSVYSSADARLLYVLYELDP
jgi:4-amino-4-deoxy-L-arabinose transferase-like glycosyltransferase